MILTQRSRFYIKFPIENTNDLLDIVQHMTDIITGSNGDIHAAEWLVNYRVDYHDYWLIVVYEERMDNVIEPEHHWKTCDTCRGKGGIKWAGFNKPLCEGCLVDAFDQEIQTRSQ